MADLEKLRANLEARGFRTAYFPTADEAAAYLDGQIDGKTVGIGGSMTVKEMGLYPRLAAHNQVVWHWEGGALRDAVLTDVYITSANALAEILGLAQVHEYRDKGGLAVGRQQRHHLVLNGLYAPADLLPQAVLHQGVDLIQRGVRADRLYLAQNLLADLIPADLHKGRQMRQRDGLAAVLVGGHLGDDLGGDVAGGGKAVRPLDQGAGDHSHLM